MNIGAINEHFGKKSNLLSQQVAKSANNLEGKSGVAKRTCSVIKQVRVSTKN